MKNSTLFGVACKRKVLGDTNMSIFNLIIWFSRFIIDNQKIRASKFYRGYVILCNNVPRTNRYVQWPALIGRWVHPYVATNWGVLYFSKLIYTSSFWRVQAQRRSHKLTYTQKRRHRLQPRLKLVLSTREEIEGPLLSSPAKNCGNL